MGAEKNERSRREYKSPGRQKFRNRNKSRDDSSNSSRDSQDRDRRMSIRFNKSRINLEIIQVINQMIEQEMVKMILNKIQQSL